MFSHKSPKDIQVKRKEDLPIELESQFILRLPPEPAQELSRAVKGGANNLKDRLSIQLENDMRHGLVRFDDYVWPAKLVDLPAIIESHKTIDRKTFYKAADICQMLICNEDDDSPKSPEEDETNKKKDKKDLHKVDKKYLWPHGLTPPLKNVRKRRFRKTLKKKVVDAPETEKEVKRLLRVDNEAVNVKWEVITEEEDGVKQKNIMGETINSSAASPAVSGPLFSNSHSLDIGEHDIFGEVVSSSDEEVDVNIVDSADDENSRLSNSNLDQSESCKEDLQQQHFVTHFNKRMLQGQSSSPVTPAQGFAMPVVETNDQKADFNDTGRQQKQQRTDENREALLDKLEDLRQQLMDVNNRRQAQELEIASIENQALKQRFKSLLDGLIVEEKEKQKQYEEVAALLKRR